jgi:TQO small subunit DoxD
MSTTNVSMSQPAAMPSGARLGRGSQIGLGFVRILIGVLWLTQLFWKLPPTFGCPTPFAFSTKTQFTSGLCDWIGREAAYAGNLHVLNIDLHLAGGGNFSIDLSPFSSIYGSFLNGFVLPNFSWMSWAIFGLELFITITMLLGLFGRLGALLGTLQALNLTIGLLPVPGEWEWTYLLLTAINFTLLITAANRFIGLDSLLRPRLITAANKGNKFARVLSWAT